MYINIQEAINLTGKSQATIYRLIKKPKSKDFIKKANDSFIIDKDYLLKIFPAQNNNNYENHYDSLIEQRLHKKFELLQDFVKEYPAALIIEKDKRIADLIKQVATKNNIIKDLTLLNNQLVTQNREQSLLIQSLQNKIDNTSNHPMIISNKVSNAQKDKIKLLTANQLKKLEVQMPLIDKFLIGLAILSSVAILTFLGIIIYTYLK